MLIVEDKRCSYPRPMAKRRELTGEEQEWADKLKRIWLSRKKDLKLTQASAADEMDMTQGAVGQYLNGTIPLNDSAAMRFARLLQVPVGSFKPRLAREYEQVSERIRALDSVQGDVSVYSIPSGQIPIISYVQAGEFCEAEDPFEPGMADEWLPFRPPGAGPRSYGLKVEGDSNDPRIRNGEIVIVDPDRAPDSGKFVVAKRHSDAKVTLKQIQYNEGEPFLKPGNPDWPEPIIKIDGDWSVCGVVIGKYDPM